MGIRVCVCVFISRIPHAHSEAIVYTRITSNFHHYSFRLLIYFVHSGFFFFFFFFFVFSFVFR